MNPNAEMLWTWLSVSLFILGCWKLVEVVGMWIRLIRKRAVEQDRAALKASAERATEEQERKEPRLGVIGGR